MLIPVYIGEESTNSKQGATEAQEPHAATFIVATGSGREACITASIRAGTPQISRLPPGSEAQQNAVKAFAADLQAQCAPDIPVVEWGPRQMARTPSELKDMKGVYQRDERPELNTLLVPGNPDLGTVCKDNRSQGKNFTVATKREITEREALVMAHRTLTPPLSSRSMIWDSQDSFNQLVAEDLMPIAAGDAAWILAGTPFVAAGATLPIYRSTITRFAQSLPILFENAIVTYTGLGVAIKAAVAHGVEPTGDVEQREESDGLLATGSTELLQTVSAIVEQLGESYASVSDAVQVTATTEATDGAAVASSLGFLTAVVDMTDPAYTQHQITGMITEVTTFGEAMNSPMPAMSPSEPTTQLTSHATAMATDDGDLVSECSGSHKRKACQTKACAGQPRQGKRIRKQTVPFE